jgi:hypothetical protein
VPRRPLLQAENQFILEIADVEIAHIAAHNESSAYLALIIEGCVKGELEPRFKVRPALK